MASTKKPTDQGPWFDGAVDEDVASPEEMTIPPISEQKPALLHETPTRRPVGAWVAIALGVLIIGFLAESVFLFRSNGPEHARSDVMSLSRRFLIALTTYDATSVPSQRTAVLAMSSGQFKSDFDRLTSNPAWAAALETAKATQSGKIVSLGVSSVSGDSATVLGVVDVTVSNKDLTVPRVDRQVLQMTLVQTSSGWLVDSVTVLGKLS